MFVKALVTAGLVVWVGISSQSMAGERGTIAGRAEPPQKPQMRGEHYPGEQSDDLLIANLMGGSCGEAALEECNRILSVHPEGGYIRLRRSDFLRQIGQNAKADEDIEYLVQNAPKLEDEVRESAYLCRAATLARMPIPHKGEHPFVQWLKSREPWKERAVLRVIQNVNESAAECEKEVPGYEVKKPEAAHPWVEWLKSGDPKKEGAALDEIQAVIKWAEQCGKLMGYNAEHEMPGRLFLGKVVLHPSVAEEHPPGWFSQLYRVTVANPEGEEDKEIKYYRNSIGMEFVLVPAGDFLMGSSEVHADAAADERPQHRVTITKPFFLGAYEVTQAQYEKVMGNNPAYFRCAYYPAEVVSWADAQEFCQRLSKREGLTYRLPTEAEWEYACRAGTTTPFHTGETITTNLANYRAVKQGELYRGETLKVGSFPANPWGLFDTHGNVWEWCQDWYGPYGEGAATDPTGPAKGTLRVLRGGCYGLDSRDCGSAKRGKHDPKDVNTYYGFRVVAVKQ